MRVRALASAAVAAGFLGQAAGAAIVPAAAATQAKAFLGQLGALGLAFAPARLPAHYAYESFSVTGSPPGLDVSFADGRFIANPTVMRVHEISFDTSFLGRAASCGSGSRGTLQVSGVRVYSRAEEVWRCLVSSRGKKIRLSASGRLPAASLALLIVSARPLSS